MNDVTVRAAALADVDALIDIEAAAFDARSWGADGVAGAFQAAGAAILVAESSDAPVGFAIWRDLGGEAELLTIGVAPAARRCGAGRSLMCALCADARGCGATRLILEVDAGNKAALGLYRDLGFEAVGRRAAYYRDGADALVLSLNL